MDSGLTESILLLVFVFVLPICLAPLALLLSLYAMWAQGKEQRALRKKIFELRRLLKRATRHTDDVTTREIKEYLIVQGYRFSWLNDTYNETKNEAYFVENPQPILDGRFDDEQLKEFHDLQNRVFAIRKDFHESGCPMPVDIPDIELSLLIRYPDNFSDRKSLETYLNTMRSRLQKYYKLQVFREVQQQIREKGYPMPHTTVPDDDDEPLDDEPLKEYYKEETLQKELFRFKNDLFLKDFRELQRQVREKGYKMPHTEVPNDDNVVNREPHRWYGMMEHDLAWFKEYLRQKDAEQQVAEQKPPAAG